MSKLNNVDTSNIKLSELSDEWLSRYSSAPKQLPLIREQFSGEDLENVLRAHFTGRLFEIAAAISCEG